MDLIDICIQYDLLVNVIGRKLKRLADDGVFTDCSVVADQTFMKVPKWIAPYRIDLFQMQLPASNSCGKRGTDLFF